MTIELHQLLAIIVFFLAGGYLMGRGSRPKVYRAYLDEVKPTERPKAENPKEVPEYDPYREALEGPLEEQKPISTVEEAE